MATVLSSVVAPATAAWDGGTVVSMVSSSWGCQERPVRRCNPSSVASGRVPAPPARRMVAPPSLCTSTPLMNARFRRTMPHRLRLPAWHHTSPSGMTDDSVSPPGAVTQWLLDWGRSDKRGLDQMLPVLYEELHRLASHYLSWEGTGHTLQPTALVHEAYLRLVDQRRGGWRQRAPFPGRARQLIPPGLGEQA